MIPSESVRDSDSDSEVGRKRSQSSLRAIKGQEEMKDRHTSDEDQNDQWDGLTSPLIPTTGVFIISMFHRGS